MPKIGKSRKPLVPYCDITTDESEEEIFGTQSLLKELSELKLSQT